MLMRNLKPANFTLIVCLSPAEETFRGNKFPSYYFSIKNQAAVNKLGDVGRWLVI